MRLKSKPQKVLKYLLATTTLFSNMLSFNLAHAAVEKKPEQLVIVSFDGSLNIDMWEKTRQLAKTNNSNITYFISGVYFLDEKTFFNYIPTKYPQYITLGKELGLNEIQLDSIRTQLGEKFVALKGQHYPGQRCPKVSDEDNATILNLAEKLTGKADSSVQKLAKLATLDRCYSSDIGFGDNPENISQRIEQVYAAAGEQNNIGSHVNGHFQGEDWTQDQWDFEFHQFHKFVENVFTLNPLMTPKEDEPAQWKSFIHQQIKGFRAPLLQGKRDILAKTLAKFNYTFDSSDHITYYKWPHKMDNGIWEIHLGDIPLFKAYPKDPNQNLPLDDKGRVQLSDDPKDYDRYPLARFNAAMDYNSYAYDREVPLENPDNTDKLIEHPKVVEMSYYYSLMNYFEENYQHSRAPVVIGNHFALWAEGAYFKALTRFVNDVCGVNRKPEVRCVNYDEAMKYLETIPHDTVVALEAEGKAAMDANLGLKKRGSPSVEGDSIVFDAFDRGNGHTLLPDPMSKPVKKGVFSYIENKPKTPMFYDIKIDFKLANGKLTPIITGASKDLLLKKAKWNVWLDKKLIAKSLNFSLPKVSQTAQLRIGVSTPVKGNYAVEIYSATRNIELNNGLVKTIELQNSEDLIQGDMPEAHTSESINANVKL